MRLAEVIYTDRVLFKVAMKVYCSGPLKREIADKFLLALNKRGIPWEKVSRRSIDLAFRELEMVLTHDHDFRDEIHK